MNVNDGLKQRIVGALVLVIVMAALLMMVLDFDNDNLLDQTSQIPAPPEIESVVIAEPVRPVDTEQPIAADEMYQMNEQRQLLEDEGVAAPAVDAEQTILSERGIPVSWVVQVGSFREAERAETLRDQLVRDGYKAYNRKGMTAGVAIYRVYVGPKIDKDKAQSERKKIEEQYGLKTLLLNFEP